MGYDFIQTISIGSLFTLSLFVERWNLNTMETVYEGTLRVHRFLLVYKCFCAVQVQGNMNANSIAVLHNLLHAGYLI